MPNNKPTTRKKRTFGRCVYQDSRGNKFIIPVRFDTLPFLDWQVQEARGHHERLESLQNWIGLEKLVAFARSRGGKKSSRQWGIYTHIKEILASEPNLSAVAIYERIALDCPEEITAEDGHLYEVYRTHDDPKKKTYQKQFDFKGDLERGYTPIAFGTFQNYVKKAKKDRRMGQ